MLKHSGGIANGGKYFSAKAKERRVKCGVPGALHIHPQGRSGWRTSILQRGRQSAGAGGSSSSWISEFVVHVSRVNSSPRRSLQTNRARLAWFWIYGSA